MGTLSATVRLLAPWALAALVACGSKKEDQAFSEDGTPQGQLLVFAAASLTDAFGALASDFEAKYPKVTVRLNFAGSQSLRTQIENGAQPQVFASANKDHMQTLGERGLVGPSQVFAHNRLVIVVPNDNPAGITGISDLVQAERIVLAESSVPAGRYAVEALGRAQATLDNDLVDQVMKKVVSREMHVRQALQKVVLGEADAAIVYATDAASAEGKAKSLAIAAEHNVVAEYPIAVVKDSPRAALGKLFVEYALSKAGQDRLESFGFAPVGK